MTAYERVVELPDEDGNNEVWRIKMKRLSAGDAIRVTECVRPADKPEGWSEVQGLVEAVGILTRSIERDGEAVDVMDCPVELLTQVTGFHPNLGGAG